MTRQYKTAAAFKQALEQRLRTASASGVELARRRQLVVFERFLARLVEELGDAMTLKGGLAVELRVKRARSTKDIDLRVVGPSANILDRLQSAAARDLGDFMLFAVRPDERHPEIRGEGMKYEGLRFRVECRVAAKVYGRLFSVDVAFADPVLGAPPTIELENTLSFAGISAPALRIYPVETHLAEKHHAYTMPRARPNSRVKDLPDIALIASSSPLSARKVRAGIEQTFAFRSTHDVPGILPQPPDAWEAPYAAMAREDELPWSTLPEVFGAAASFLDPVLQDADGLVRRPDTWSWFTDE